MSGQKKWSKNFVNRSKKGVMVYLSNRSVLFSEQYLIAYMEATNRKELSLMTVYFIQGGRREKVFIVK